MFTEKEKIIMQALLEDEIKTISDQQDSNDTVFAQYSNTLAKILLKMKLNDCDNLDNECYNIINREFASRQAV